MQTGGLMSAKISKIIISLSFIITFSGPLYGQLRTFPQYNLRAMNFEYKSINYPNDAIEFDIYIEHTNPPVIFEYLGGQYHFNFNRHILTGHWPPAGDTDTSEYSYKIIGSDITVPHFHPRNSVIRSIGSDQSGALFLSSNMLMSNGGYILTGNGYPGTKIVRMKLWNKKGTMSNVPLSLEWRNTFPNPFTKVFALLENFVPADISTPATHFIDSSGLGNQKGIRLSLSVLFHGKYYQEHGYLSSRDTATIYLRDAEFPYSVRDSAKGIIDSVTFSGLFTFSNAPTGKYYIVVRHFQSIETWSREGGDTLRANQSVQTYDFTASPSQAYGNNLKLKGGKYCLHTGDVDQNGFIDASDAAKVQTDSQILLTGRHLVSDLNGDNVVNGLDVLIADNSALYYVGKVVP